MLRDSGKSAFMVEEVTNFLRNVKTDEELNLFSSEFL